MKKLIVFVFVGFIAQLIDGSLGMAYGVTSTTLLLTFGIAPAVASASVHLAEVVTTAASGVSHWKFGNIDRDMVVKLIIPGSVGAFVGACFLSNLPGDLIKPCISLFLLALGFYIIYRFLFLTARLPPKEDWEKSKQETSPFRQQSFSNAQADDREPLTAPSESLLQKLPSRTFFE